MFLSLKVKKVRFAEKLKRYENLLSIHYSLITHYFSGSAVRVSYSLRLRKMLQAR